MNTTRCIVTAWIRLPSSGPSLYDRLVVAVGEPPFESTELGDIRDLQWAADNPNDALAKADRLKPFHDDPALILLKTATYHASGSVDGVTIKDERATLRRSAASSDPAPAAPAPAGDDREQFIHRIEQAGYRLEGWRDTVSDRDSGPITILAIHQATGHTYTATSRTPGADGERLALNELATRIGLDTA